MKKIRLLSLLPLLAAGLLSPAMATTEADVENSFNPYKNGFPSFPGLSVGTVINKGNVEQFKDVLDPGMYLTVKNGWTEVKVGPTTQFQVDRHYVDATKANINKTKLGAKVGEISGFIAGRPFPDEPDMADPRAGEKMAWNFKYNINMGDNTYIGPFYWKYRKLMTGVLERTISFKFYFLNFKHRVQNPPVPEITPNPANLYRGTYAQVLEPQDLKNTQLLIQRFDDDTKLDDAYLYLGFQRRVRRLATGQTTDAFLGSDLMIEDFEGYNGRVAEMKWTFKGAKNLMVPLYNHNEMKLSEEYQESDGYRFIDFGGQGGCFPNITWQLRKTYVLEAEPVLPSHPIGKRVLYIDAQLFSIVHVTTYDRKGEMWKNQIIGKSHADSHLPINKGTGVSVDDLSSMVDMQAKHCTTLQFKAQVDPKATNPGLFQVQNLRGGN